MSDLQISFPLCELQYPLYPLFHHTTCSLILEHFGFDIMDIPEPVEEAHKVESKEILLRVLQQSIFAWILLEYYHSYSILVLLLRAVQAVRGRRSLEDQSDVVYSLFETLCL